MNVRHSLRAGIAVAFIVQPQVVAADETDAKDTIAILDQRDAALPADKTISNGSDKAREHYRAVMDLASDDPGLRAESMRRLAGLELEATEAEQLATNAGMVDADAFASPVSLYIALLEAFPDYERNDLLLYQLARAYEAVGRPDESLKALDEIVARYPDTPEIAEVQFRRGETLFLVRDYDNAEAAYGSVVDYGDKSRFYEQSLYKLGWSRFKLGWHEDSLDPFLDLLDRKLAGASRSGGDLSHLTRPERELVEDTLRVLSICFSYLDGARSVAAVFDERGHPAYGHVVYSSLGDLYLEKERFQDAAEAYAAFVQVDPTHPAAPALQGEAIEAYRRGGFPTLVLESKKEFVGRYGMGAPYWKRNRRADNPGVEESLKNNLDDLARFYHAEAQANDSQADYLEAARWYRERIENFGREHGGDATAFLLAESLFQGRQLVDAIALYERIAYEHPPGGYSAEAAYAAVLAHREYEDSLADDAIVEWHQRYIASGLRFAESYPDHPQSNTVLTAIAEDLFEAGALDDAIAVAERVVGRDAPVDAALARTAWSVIAHSRFDLGDFADAEQAYVALQPLVAEGESGIREEVGERIASSIYKQGETARDAGDLEAAVTHFRRVGHVVPDSGIRETAEYDAAATLITMRAWDGASRVLEEFRRDYPDSRFAEEVSQKLAVSYLEAGRDALAAAEFVRVSNAPGLAEAMQREALWRAADLYADNGADEEERSVLQGIIDRFPSPVSESIEARVRLLNLATQNGEDERRVRLLGDIVSADANAGSERTDRTRYLAAKASLELAEPVRRNFMQMKISQPLAEHMDRKKSLMEQVIRAYGDAARYGIAEVTTAATFWLGEAYRQFAADLMASERPAGLDEMALEQYDLLLEEQVYPFEEKAIELFESNAARTAEGLWDEWVQKSLAALAAMMPARYRKAERSENVFTIL